MNTEVKRKRLYLYTESNTYFIADEANAARIKYLHIEDVTDSVAHQIEATAKGFVIPGNGGPVQPADFGVSPMEFKFDATQVKPSTLGEPWEGEHPIVISAFEVKPTKDDTGGYLGLTLKAIDGPYKDRTHPYNLNLWNKSEAATRIAGEQMSALCHVTGVYRFATTDDIAQILNKPFRGIFGKQKSDPTYSEMKGVKDAQGRNPGATTGGTQATAGAQPAAQAWTPAPAAPAPAAAAPAPAPAPAAAAPWPPAPWRPHPTPEYTATHWWDGANGTATTAELEAKFPKAAPAPAAGWGNGAAPAPAAAAAPAPAAQSFTQGAADPNAPWGAKK